VIALVKLLGVFPLERFFVVVETKDTVALEKLPVSWVGVKDDVAFDLPIRRDGQAAVNLELAEQDVIQFRLAVDLGGRPVKDVLGRVTGEERSDRDVLGLSLVEQNAEASYRKHLLTDDLGEETETEPVLRDALRKLLELGTCLEQTRVTPKDRTGEAGDGAVDHVVEDGAFEIRIPLVIVHRFHAW
jgi:hypothetical protein